MPHDQHASNIIDAEERFEAHREDLDAEAHHGGTEMGWLVSYADMMTLLFGLFVILYSLARDKTSNVDEVMKQVSQQMFQTPAEAVVTPEVKPIEPPPTEQPAAPPEEVAQAEPTTPEQPVTEAAKPDPEATLHEVKETAAREKAQIEKKVEELSAKIASLEKDKSTLSNTNADTSAKTKSLESQVTDLQKQLEETKAESESLRSQMAAQKAAMQSYMMVVLKWDTEKHDVDLQIETPKKKTFSFKRREIAGEPGKFELDSRYGPGMEMWKAENFAPGEYRARITLYNTYGNEKDAKATLSVVTNHKTYAAPSFNLNESRSEIVVPFSIDADGAVKFGR